MTAFLVLPQRVRPQRALPLVGEWPDAPPVRFAGQTPVAAPVPGAPMTDGRAEP